MKITSHAVKRFLERVKQKYRFKHKEFIETKYYLENLFASVVTSRSLIPLPNHKGFRAVIRKNSVITILPK